MFGVSKNVSKEAEMIPKSTHRQFLADYALPLPYKCGAYVCCVYCACILQHHIDEARVAVQCSSVYCTPHSHTKHRKLKRECMCLPKVKRSRSYRPHIYAHPYCQNAHTQKRTQTTTIIWLKSFYKRHKILKQLPTRLSIQRRSERKKNIEAACHNTLCGDRLFDWFN